MASSDGRPILVLQWQAGCAGGTTAYASITHSLENKTNFLGGRTADQKIDISIFDTPHWLAKNIISKMGVPRTHASLKASFYLKASTQADPCFRTNLV